MISILCLIFGVILLAVVFPSRSSKITNALYVIIGVLLAGVAAFRPPNSDRDYLIYKYYWDTRFFFDVEYSFIIIKTVLKEFFGFPVLSLFIVYAIAGVFVKLQGIKTLSTTLFLSLLVYVGNYYLVHELTQIRAGVAAGIFLISIKYIYERRFWPFFLLILLAGFFHYSAFMALPLYLLTPTQKYLKVYAAIIPIGIILFFLGVDVIANVPIPYVQSRIEMYKLMRDSGIDDAEAFNVFSMSFLTKISIFFMLYLNRVKLFDENKYAYLLLKIYAISLFVFPLLAEIPAFSYRVQSLFGVVDIILVPLLATLFRHRLVGFAAVVVVAAGFFYYNIAISELIK